MNAKDFISKVIDKLNYVVNNLNRMISKSPDKSKLVITEGLKKNAEIFIGLYETMYLVSNGKLSSKVSVFREWCIRAKQINDPPFNELFTNRYSLYNKWSDKVYIQNAKDIINAVFQSGIIRDPDSGIIITETNIARYGTLDGREIEVGDKVKVLKPCWYRGDIILEHGIVK